MLYRPIFTEIEEVTADFYRLYLREYKDSVVLDQEYLERIAAARNAKLFMEENKRIQWAQKRRYDDLMNEYARDLAKATKYMVRIKENLLTTMMRDARRAESQTGESFDSAVKRLIEERGLVHLDDLMLDAEAAQS